jgi:hypothetical protein
MNIIIRYDDIQRNFHLYWLPLMYKHGECEFYMNVGNDFICPKDVNNLKLNQSQIRKGHPTLECPANKVPTYRAMEQLNKKDSTWRGSNIDLGERFYDV